MLETLPRRERQLLDALFSLGEGSAEEIRAAMEDPPGNSAVRAMLTRLQAKGFVCRRAEGARHIYKPALAQAAARTNVLQQVVRTFFDGSPARAATALLGMAETIDDAELEQLQALIARTREARR